MSKQTILEYAPTSLAAEEYYYLITEEWHRIINDISEEITVPTLSTTVDSEL